MKMSESIKVKYTTEIIINSLTLVPDGYSCISFQNIGECDATILDNIPLSVDDPERCFKNDPGQIISCHIPVLFANTEESKKILIVKTYYELSK